MSDVSDALAGLTPEQRERLTERLRQRRRAAAGDDRIRPRPDPRHHPLSVAQERIWTLSRLRPDDPVYNLHEAKRLRGPLDVGALRRAFAEVVRRHETLRASFVDDRGRPRQHIAPADQIDVDIVDVIDVDDDDALTQSRKIARHEAEQPFDLARGPLLRVRLLRRADDDHVLLVTVHHIICDGWSMGVIEAEVSAIYQAHTSGGTVDLDQPELQYADISHWQHERGEAAGHAALEYWAQQLTPGVERLRLPGDDGRPAGRTATGAHRSIEVPPDLTSEVIELSRHARATPFITLLAAFLVLLNRHTGQEDLIVCSPVAGRQRRETERMVGYFNNLVVMRGDLSGDPSFAEVVRRLRPVVSGAFDHQQAPFQTVAALGHLARTPLTRALFVLQDADNRPLTLPGVQVATLTVEAATADFDLGVFLRPARDRLVGTVRYRTGQFDDATITTLFTSFQRVLELVVSDPARRLSELPTFTTPAGSGRETAAAVNAQPMAHPRSAVESQLRDIWQRLFNTAEISIHDDFFELGGHSLLAAELAAEVEQHITGRPLPLATLFAEPTIAQLARLIDRGEWDDAWSSLVAIKPTGTRPPLFFVHAHGGNVIGYRDLARHLPADQPFYGLQAPDMDVRAGTVEPRSIPEIAGRYLREVRSVQPEGPYFFGGWCLGGDVAYEMAAQSRSEGLDVPLVIMVDNPRPAHLATSRSGSALTRLGNRLRTRAIMEWDNISELTGRARWAHIAGRLRHVLEVQAVRAEGRMAAAIDRTSIHLPMSRARRRELVAAAHEQAYQAYEPPAYDGAVALFRAERQPIGRANDQSLGWSGYVRGRLMVHDVPGHRIGLLSEPRVGSVAARMVTAMEQSLTSRHLRHR